VLPEEATETEDKDLVYWRRYDTRTVAWITEGVEGEIIGDFGWPMGARQDSNSTVMILILAPHHRRASSLLPAATATTTCCRSRRSSIRSPGFPAPGLPHPG
jgi:hypothetical protein